MRALDRRRLSRRVGGGAALKLLLDARQTRRMSLGMRAYAGELAARLPRVAPDIAVTTFARGENFTLFEQVALPLAARGQDLVHFPTIFAPAIRTRPYVLTVHDLIHLRYPQFFGASTAAYYAVAGRRLARGAVRVLVGDERTVEDCIRFLGVRRDRIRVVPLGYDPAFLDVPAHVAERPYFLYAGNHRPHKNLPALVAAWRGLPPELEIDLCLTGSGDLGLDDTPPRRPIFLGALSPAALAARLRGARALVHPALAEGFGLPMLEALVRGTPVIASAESVPSILETSVAAFPARDVAALRSLLEEAVRAPEPLRRRAAEGEARARAYTWDRFAASTASVYREAWEDTPHR